MPSIAVVGMACRFPDARTTGELWENVLAQRRAFRRIPEQRLRLEDYFSGDPDFPDRTYSPIAAVIEGYEFDRARFNVSSAAFRSADLTHWLALDVAAQAVADAGFASAAELPRSTTGVYVGNTLAGEFSRANVLRLRWPYVRRMVASALDAAGIEGDRSAFLDRLERQYKSPFPEVGAETLAGGMSNTIAGRIANHFDLNGGAYSVDGACASSLLSITTACAALTAGDIDVALAGGVDLSLDPFELVGFAKTGALARDIMRVYDASSSGFWPGEGCGMLVLMRYEDAVSARRRIYAVVRGWGISSDGAGGITRPTVEGQMLALRRAYLRAGFGPETVAYFEGHGTGTQVGDATELKALTRTLAEADASEPAVLGSIKANIGHTKAAAGVAGFIKAALSVHHGILPPMTGMDRPHPELALPNAVLRLAPSAEPWPEGRTARGPEGRKARAAVSAMGFGGINAHAVLERDEGLRAEASRSSARTMAASVQDAELFVFAAESASGLRASIERVARFAPQLSYAELGDLAAELHRRLEPGAQRAAVVASSPSALAQRLEALCANLATDASQGIFYGDSTTAPRIGFLFPGQGAPSHVSGGIWRRRFHCAADLYARVSLPTAVAQSSTEVAQPAIVTASLCALGVLSRLGVNATLAIGHSLGELTALHWAGAFDEETLLRIATIRGRAMGALNGTPGAMVSINAGPLQVRQLLNGPGAAIAAFNSPAQTVVSGDASAVGALAGRARARGFDAVPLPVSHAFHSALVAPAAPVLTEALQSECFTPPTGTVCSTVLGGPLPSNADLRALIARQVTEPVRFTDALAAAAGRVDLWIEAGPGTILANLVRQVSASPAFSLDAGGPSIEGLLTAAAALFTSGAPVRLDAAFTGRFTRPFSLDWKPAFFSSPCESRPALRVREPAARAPQPVSPSSIESSTVECLGKEVDALKTVRLLVAERCDLPESNIRDDSRMLSHLHLNSIVVGQLVAEAARRAGVPTPLALTEYADATVAEIARAIEESRHLGETASDSGPRVPAGVDTWFRAFQADFVERPLHARSIAAGKGSWTVAASPNHPLAEPLRRVFADVAGHGVILCLPPADELLNSTGEVSRQMLEAAKGVLKQRVDARLVIVQHGGGGAPLGLTLHQEAPEVTCAIVDIPFDAPDAALTIAQEALAARGCSEVHYDAAGLRRLPRLGVLPNGAVASPLPLTPGDVLLVTGGGKGIAAECGLSLARASGCQLALVGRSDPEADEDLRLNLRRLEKYGVRYLYLRADVTNAVLLREAIARYKASAGPVTAVLHGAGTNVPRLIPALTEEAFEATLAPKIDGLRNVLAAIDPAQLHLLITFGSLTARVGMRGEADYALANHWLTLLTEQWQTRHRDCRCVALEWSVWSGAGMGQRLGRVDALWKQGITPMPIDEALKMLESALSRQDAPVAQVLTGRFGNPPVLQAACPELPFRRFLERTRTYIPGVELIVEAELSQASDPYLADHVYRGQQILPGVIGIEAMAQAAMALLETDHPPDIEEVRFDQPVVVPQAGQITIRIAALIREDVCEVVLRCSETAFQADHFRMVCRAGAPLSEERSTAQLKVPSQKLPLDPGRDLYGGLLFHTGRFCRVECYRSLRATECIAQTRPTHSEPWFWQYAPQELVLGDPGMRDAAVHAIQACIPDSILLPVAVERITTVGLTDAGAVFAHASERSRQGDLFIYDLDIISASGLVLERWTGLSMKRIEAAPSRDRWPAPLLACLLERRAAALAPGWIDVSISPTDAVQASEDLHRLDGKPESASLSNGLSKTVSRAYSGGLVFSVRGQVHMGPVSCDLEAIVARSVRDWADLLGPRGMELAEFLARQSGMDFDAASTGVWCALECLKKAGVATGAPLVLASSSSADAVFRCGALAITMFLATTAGTDSAMVFAILVRAGAKDAVV